MLNSWWYTEHLGVLTRLRVGYGEVGGAADGLAVETTCASLLVGLAPHYFRVRARPQPSAAAPHPPATRGRAQSLRRPQRRERVRVLRDGGGRTHGGGVEDAVYCADGVVVLLPRGCIGRHRPRCVGRRGFCSPSPHPPCVLTAVRSMHTGSSSSLDQRLEVQCASSFAVLQFSDDVSRRAWTGGVDATTTSPESAHCATGTGAHARGRDEQRRALECPMGGEQVRARFSEEAHKQPRHTWWRVPLFTVVGRCLLTRQRSRSGRGAVRRLSATYQ